VRAIVTNALYEGKYPLVSALSRPVIAGAVAEVALDVGAEAVVHGCTGKGNDQLRFELAFGEPPGAGRASLGDGSDARRGD
jgi:argininosuccinate synthase